jgi:hypothetical protein
MQLRMIWRGGVGVSGGWSRRARRKVFGEGGGVEEEEGGMVRKEGRVMGGWV